MNRTAELCVINTLSRLKKDYKGENMINGAGFSFLWNLILLFKKSSAEVALGFEIAEN